VNVTKYASQKYTFSPLDVLFQSSSKQCIYNVVTGRHICRPVNNFCRPVIETRIVLLGDSFFVTKQLKSHTFTPHLKFYFFCRRR